MHDKSFEGSSLTGPSNAEILPKMTSTESAGLSVRACVGADVGGTLTKVVFFEPYRFDEQEHGKICRWLKSAEQYGSSGRRDRALEVDVPAMGGRFHFMQFLTSRMEGAIKIILKHNLERGLAYTYATGGGAHKFQERFKTDLGINLVPRDELGTIVSGIGFMLKHVPDEVYGVSMGLDENGELSAQAPLVRVPCVLPVDNLFPLLLCNVGSGVSVVKVESPQKFQRVSGTALGGGTFLGLCRLLTKAKNFDEALGLAATGDGRKVNLLVRDIYGGDLNTSFSLSGDLVASFFAKNLNNDQGHVRDGMDDSDICHAACVMVAQNITQIAHMTARLHGLNRVFFTGNFLRHNDIAQRTVASQMQRWVEIDGVRTEVYFFRHEGYFGSLGAFLENLNLERDSD